MVTNAHQIPSPNVPMLLPGCPRSASRMASPAMRMVSEVTPAV
jgi:hypothetical protein